MLRRFYDDCSGASAGEYALLLALAVGIAGAAYHLATVESEALMRAGDMIFAYSNDSPGSGDAGASAGSGVTALATTNEDAAVTGRGKSAGRGSSSAQSQKPGHGKGSRHSSVRARATGKDD